MTTPHIAAKRVFKSNARRILAGLIAALFLSVLLVAVQPPGRSSAASGADFEAGNIIDDAIFFDSGTMTVAQIQSFLNSKVPSCRGGYTCLKDYAQNTTSHAADPMCSTYTGARNESAATIIYKVARACNINPKVLIVTLQKEQGLITDDWPGTRQYRSAMGYGCPDTADCDAEYYGFFNQVYKGAWALQRYTMPEGTGSGTAWYSNYNQYAPGRTVNVLHHPDSTCGTKSVYIENKATGSLYTYTPYTPNVSALSAGYGTGNSCGAYGNRNFFYYFTDWFGSTHATGSMIRVSGDSEVYLVVGARKHHVPNRTVQSTFSVLGPTRLVSRAYLDTFTTGIDLSPIVRDPRTKVVGLVQDGKRHRFDSCDRVASWGYRCGDYVNLSPSQAALLPLGTEVSDFFRVAGISTIYRRDGETASPVDGPSYAATLNGGVAPFVGTMSALAAAEFDTGPLLMSPPAAPAKLIKSSDQDEVYFIDSARKIHLPTWGVADALGPDGYDTLSKSRVAAYPTAEEDLTQMVRCGGAPYFGADGTLYKIDPDADHGLGVTALEPSTCSALRRSSASAAEGLWIREASASNVYEVVDGKRRLIPDKVTFDARRGGTSPASLAVGARQMATIPLGEPLPSVTDAPPATLMKRSDQKEVYLVDGTARKVHLPSWAVGDALGLSGFRVVSASTADSFPTAEGDLTQVVSCGGVPYFGADGTLYKLDAAAKHGLGITFLESSTCSVLKKSGASAAKAIWIRVSSTSDVYEVVDGKRRLVPDKVTFDARRGGMSPGSLAIGARQMAAIPVGEALPSATSVPPATLMKRSDQNEVYFVDGTAQKIHLPSWAVGDALGLADYSVLVASVVDHFSTAEKDLTQVVSCGGVPYFGADGTLYKLDAAAKHGLGITFLESSTCSVLKKSGASAAKAIWIRVSSTSDVYEVVDGKRRLVPDKATFDARRGGTSPGSLAIGARQMAAIPMGEPLPGQSG